jgi:hypothetical protein
MAPNKTVEPPILENPFDTQFSFPVDFALFTFGHHCPYEDNSLIYSLLGDLYSVLSIAESSGEAMVAPATHEYIAYQRERAYHPISLNTIQDCIDQGDGENIMAAPIRLCTFLLTSYLISGTEIHEACSLAQITSIVRTRLSATRIGIEYSTTWIPFPGALLWCYAIGLWFADTKDKTWFRMHFLRISHLGVLEKWDEACKSIFLISKALRNIHPMCMEGI